MRQQHELIAKAEQQQK